MSEELRRYGTDTLGVPLELLRTRMSLRAHGVAMVMLAWPEGEPLSVDRIAHRWGPGADDVIEGDYAIRQAIAELRQAGFVRTRDIRNEDGRFRRVTEMRGTLLIPWPDARAGADPAPYREDRGTAANSQVTPNRENRGSVEGPVPNRENRGSVDATNPQVRPNRDSSEHGEIAAVNTRGNSKTPSTYPPCIPPTPPSGGAEDAARQMAERLITAVSEGRLLDAEARPITHTSGGRPIRIEGTIEEVAAAARAELDAANGDSVIARRRLRDRVASGDTFATPTRKGKRKAERDRALERAERPDSRFDEWWAIYPRGEGKQKAREAYGRALEVVTAQELIDAAGAYRESCTDPSYAHAATWLNQRRWEDEFRAGRTMTLERARGIEGGQRMPLPGERIADVAALARQMVTGNGTTSDHQEHGLGAAAS